MSSEDELRPISLTPCLSKILEDFVVKWLMFDIRHMIDPKQFGSLKGSSTTFCLIDMVDNWLKSLDNPSHYLRVCFLDFSKAFDRINHNILITKLLSLGARASLVPWICDFLTNRRQSVKIGSFRSDWAFINGGVPQGTKLGPILFLVVINDLELKSPLSYHWKYVDDISISECIPAQGCSSLQSDLDEIQQCASRNDMMLNGKKCKEMNVNFLRQSLVITPLSIDGQSLDQVLSFKVLGVTLNHRLKWDAHVEVTVKKASKRLYILRVLRRSGVPPSDLLLIYISLVRSVLEYACSVWHTSLTKGQSNAIELIQKRAFRIIYPGVHYADALQNANCIRTDERRHELCLKTFKKIGNPSSQLHHLFPVSRGSMHGRSLRNNNSSTLPSSKCHTERYIKSFIPAMCYNH